MKESLMMIDSATGYIQINPQSNRKQQQKMPVV